MERQRFSSLLDMIDGGGMGASGNEFKGGGLLSDVANALFQPRGYRDRMDRLGEVRPQMRPPTMGPRMPTQSPPTMPDGPAGAGGSMRGPGMPGGPVQPMPMQFAPQMPQDPMTPQMPTSGGTPQARGPMMPGGPMPQEAAAPAPMGVDAAMAQLESVLTPSERQTLQSMPMDQRMGMIQRLIQMRQGGM